MGKRGEKISETMLMRRERRGGGWRDEGPGEERR